MFAKQFRTHVDRLNEGLSFMHVLWFGRLSIFASTELTPPSWFFPYFWTHVTSSKLHLFRIKTWNNHLWGQSSLPSWQRLQLQISSLLPFYRPCKQPPEKSLDRIFLYLSSTPFNTLLQFCIPKNAPMNVIAVSKWLLSCKILGFYSDFAGHCSVGQYVTGD